MVPCPAHTKFIYVDSSYSSMKGHEEMEDVDVPEEKPFFSGPIKIIVGIFLILLLVMWLVPAYGVKHNPEPNYGPTLDELQVPQMSIPDISSSDIRDYVQVTPDIKRIADKIVTLSCPQTSKVCNAKAIFYFVRDNFNYVNDPLAFEYYKTPEESFASSVGDCDDSSVLGASLLNAVGLQTRFVFVPGHVYIQVKLPDAISAYKEDGNWINLDMTCQGCKFGEVHYNYVNAEKRYVG
jgi:transglutaminase-like putative cysteine protease